LHDELTRTGIQNVVMPAAFKALELDTAVKLEAFSAEPAELVS
jgi:hypothetical protein